MQYSTKKLPKKQREFAVKYAKISPQYAAELLAKTGAFLGRFVGRLLVRVVRNRLAKVQAKLPK